MNLYTVGHSTRTAAEFVDLLRSHGVAFLLDVRRYPGSRRHPQFSQESLRRTLAGVGIGYRHAPELGGRRAPEPHSVNDAWRSASFRGYADHMATGEFEEALEQLLADAAAAPTAIMCAEAVPWRCHRQLIADALVARGHTVLNILSPDRAEPHRLNAQARVHENGSVTYPAGTIPDDQYSLF